jgi:pilus assembly protein CpaE
MNLLWDVDTTAIDRLRFALGSDAQVLATEATVTRALQENPAITLVAIGPDIDLDRACTLADGLRITRPEVGVVLLRHRLDVTALTTALRSGIREVVASDDHTALAEAVRRSRELSDRLSGGGAGGAGGKGRVITVFSSKGGVGKTTLSANLGVLLAGQGKSVLLVDLDLAFGDVAITLQLTPVQSVFDAVAMAGHRQGRDPLL